MLTSAIPAPVGRTDPRPVENTALPDVAALALASYRPTVSPAARPSTAAAHPTQRTHELSPCTRISDLQIHSVGAPHPQTPSMAESCGRTCAAATKRRSRCLPAPTQAGTRTPRTHDCFGLPASASTRRPHRWIPRTTRKPGATDQRDQSARASGQRAAPLLQAAVVVDATTSTKQQSAPAVARCARPTEGVAPRRTALFPYPCGSTAGRRPRRAHGGLPGSPGRSSQFKHPLSLAGTAHGLVRQPTSLARISGRCAHREDCVERAVESGAELVGIASDLCE